MNIFEIINNKKYDNLAVIDDGEKTYTLGWIKSQLAPETVSYTHLTLPTKLEV